MPELPEVEHFRSLLLPLVSSSTTLSLQLTSDKPPRSFLTKESAALLDGKVFLTDVKRKGKLICMVLTPKLTKKRQKDSQDCHYLFLHMGMTGRIATPAFVPKLESQQSTEYPPKHTHVVFKSGDNSEACFSDPRKFGSVTLSTSLGDGFAELSPDALVVVADDVVGGLADQKVSIKAILLDQKRVMSGVGNWVADEVLNQSRIHPEQKYLSEEEARIILAKTKEILATAVDCLERRKEFPTCWLFHVRWSKRSSTNGSSVKDAEGRQVSFITTGGRTSAIVASIQKLQNRQLMVKSISVGSKRKETQKVDEKPSKKARGQTPISPSQKKAVKKDNMGCNELDQTGAAEPDSKAPRRSRLTRST